MRSSEYMYWAKHNHATARYNLGVSGMPGYPLADLGVKIEDLEVNGPTGYGYAPLQEALARKCGVTTDCVVAAAGTSMANQLAMAALLEPGDEVLIEHPAYGLLEDAARYLGADVRRFERSWEAGFALDPAAVERTLTPRTSMVVVTNLHNPSSAFTSEETMCAIGKAARRVDAWVLVDEVYLDAVFDRPARSAFHLGENFVITNSLTKVYGLSGLRCGWILAPPKEARKMWRLNDLFGVNAAHPAELLSVKALEMLPQIAARTRALLDANREIFNRFLASCKGLQGKPLELGTVSFPRLVEGSGDDFCRLLREKYETSVVPGSFFGMEQHFRIGICCPTDTLRIGLEHLDAALAEFQG
jgi:hypothetical protein